MANMRTVTEDAQFQPELVNAGTKLVVVDFHAVWCGPCRRIAPVVDGYATKYPNAVFLKVDVDQCPDTASGNNVSAMPTFVFFRNKIEIDRLRGADPNALEDKIKKWYGSGEENDDAGVKGFLDLTPFLVKSGCECLNESDDHPLDHCLTSKGGYLESDVDEQLIIALAFNQVVKLHSLKLHGPPDKGPKMVKIFINQPRTLDFDQAESMTPVQTLELTPEDLREDSIIGLKFVKYQNVQNITVFIKDNQANEETTQVDHLCFIGTPALSTNMSDFKRVAGKKGESH